MIEFNIRNFPFMTCEDPLAPPARRRIDTHLEVTRAYICKGSENHITLPVDCTVLSAEQDANFLPVGQKASIKTFCVRACAYPER